MNLEIKNYSKKQYTRFDLKEVVERIVSKIPREYLEGLIEIELLDEPAKEGTTIFAHYVPENINGLGRIVIYLPVLFGKCGDQKLKNKFLVYLLIGYALGHELSHHQNCILKTERNNEQQREEYEADTFGSKMAFDVLNKLFPYRIDNWITKLQLWGDKDRYNFIQGILHYPIEWQRYYRTVIQVSALILIVSLLNFGALINFLIKGPAWVISLNLMQGILYLFLAILILALKDKNLIYRIIVCSFLCIAEIVEYVLKGIWLYPKPISGLITLNWNFISVICLLIGLIALIRLDFKKMSLERGKKIAKQGLKLVCKGEYEKAKRILTKVFNRDRTNDFIRMLLQVIDAVLNKKLDPNIAHMLFEGFLCVSCGKEDQALREFNKLFQEDPNLPYPWLYYSRAQLYFKKGLLKEAESDITKAISLDNQFYYAYLLRSDIYLKQEQYEKVIDDMNKAIEINDHVANNYFVRGYCYERNKIFAEAIKDYSKAIELDPKNTSGHIKEAEERIKKLDL